MPRTILIDTDPGQDDAVAILFALASPELAVHSIVTVGGNVPLELTTANALKILEAAGQSTIPVHSGLRGPQNRQLVTAEHVHGPTGLDGPNLPAPRLKPASHDGVAHIVETLRALPPGTVTICTLGPLTNLAAAIRQAPDIVVRIAEIVMMGGAYFEVGNITPAAEFNIFVDPEAAAAVLTCGAPITMLPLDVTHQALATRERLARVRALGNHCGRIVYEMLSYSERFDLNKYGWDGAPLHDPCVIGWLLRPDLFEGRLINVTVEIDSPLTRGMTVADYWRITDRPRNVRFMRNLNADGFYALLTERLARLP